MNNNPTYQTEHQLQAACVRWFKEYFPEYIIFSTHNETAYSRWNYFQESGALAGVPDLVIIIRGEVLFVEMKSSRGILSDAQLSMENKIQRLGHRCYEVRSLKDFKNIFDE